MKLKHLIFVFSWICLTGFLRAEKLQAGAKLNRFEVAGVLYEDVTIRKVEKGRVYIMHSTGTASFTREQLPGLYKESIPKSDVEVAALQDRQMDIAQASLEREVEAAKKNLPPLQRVRALPKHTS